MLKGRQLFTFHLGVVMIVGSIVFGVVTYYYAVNLWLEDGELIAVLNGEDQPQTTFFPLVPGQYIHYPLRYLHFWTYLWLVGGIVITISSFFEIEERKINTEINL